MTWNTWWRFGGRWAEREPLVTAVVEVVAPDVLALQETWFTATDSQAQRLARQTGGHAVVVPTPLPPRPGPPEYPEQDGVGMAIGLVSRWPVRATVVHRLPATRREPPTAFTATLAHPFGPLHVLVACTEWEAEAFDDHCAQTRALASLLTDPALDGELPVVLAGDLNADVSSEQLAPLRAVAVDLWEAADGDADAVTLSSAHPRAPLETVQQIDHRIDHVLARPGRPHRPVIARGATLAGDRAVDGLHPSDHRAVVVDLEVDTP